MQRFYNEAFLIARSAKRTKLNGKGANMNLSRKLHTENLIMNLFSRKYKDKHKCTGINVSIRNHATFVTWFCNNNATYVSSDFLKTISYIWITLEVKHRPTTLRKQITTDIFHSKYMKHCLPFLLLAVCHLWFVQHRSLDLYHFWQERL